VNLDNTELLLLNHFPQLRELCFKHQIQSLLYRQQITLVHVNVFLDNSMRTFRTRCHTHTQVYVLICKTSDKMNLKRHPCSFNMRYQPTMQFQLFVLEIRAIARENIIAWRLDDGFPMVHERRPCPSFIVFAFQ
jgi:hypothetical protein